MAVTPTGYQGENITLDVQFFSPSNVLTDPDVIPTYAVYDPANALIVSGNGTKLSTGHWQAVYFIPLTADLGVWSIVWTATIASVPVINNLQTFNVADAKAKPITQSISIDTQWLRQIKRVQAFPGVEKILLTDDEMKEFVVFPALYEYFRKFPRKFREEYIIDQETTVPFPDNLTFGAISINVTEKFGSVGSTGVPFIWDMVRYQSQYGASGAGSYGTRYNFGGMRQSYMMNRISADSVSNLYSTQKVFVNHEDRQVEAYFSSQAKLVITWAKYSTDFANVKFSRIHQVIELAQSYYLNHLADSAHLLEDAQLDKKFNADAIKTGAQEIYDRIVTNGWLTEPDIVIVRN